MFQLSLNIYRDPCRFTSASAAARNEAGVT
jgi:hypothetical protein